MRLFLVLIVWHITALDLLAQGCCSGGVSVGSNMGTAPSIKGQLQLVLIHDVNVLKSFMTEDEVDRNDRSRTRRVTSELLELDYGVTDWLTATIIFSYIQQYRDVNGDDFRLQGIGDLILMVKSRVAQWNTGNSSLALGGGLKLPTGSTEETSRLGSVQSLDLQPGSGSLDFIFWSHIFISRLIANRFNFTSYTNLRFTGEKTNHSVLNSYELGDELQWSVGLTDQTVLGRFPLDRILMLRYRSVGSDVINEIDLDASGGQELHLVPGVNFHMSPKIMTLLNGSIPIYRRVNGSQLATTWKLTIGLNLKF